jgi:phage-related protein
MPELVRRISWPKAARKEFDDFPQGVQVDMATALTQAARGRKADTVEAIQRRERRRIRNRYPP